MKKITEQISYLPASAQPLSADVGVIRLDKETWIYDVGNAEEAAVLLNGLEGHKNVVLSHFHPDHTGNLASVRYDALYGGAFTCRKLKQGNVVDRELYFESGVHLFPLPSSHAKGCLGLEYGGYAFLGDGLYCMVKDGRAVYNAGMLREQILVLEALQAELFLQSHGEPFVCPKAEVLAFLKEIYARRDRQSPYIEV